MDWTNRLTNIQNKLRGQLHAKKIDDLEYLYTLIQKFDKDNSGTLSRDEFEKFLTNLGVFFTTQELRVIYDTYDKNKDKNISYAEFIQMIRTSMSEKRLAVVKHAFQFLDTSRSGKLPLQYLFLKYNAAAHPRVRTRQKTANEVIDGFKNAISQRSADGVHLVESEFLQYYADVNSTLPLEKQEYFVDIVLSTWGITSSIDYVSNERLAELELIIYQKIRQKTFTKEDEAQTVRQAFQYFDILDTGVIDFKQFGDALNQFGCQFSDKELAALFNQYDKDRSGQICYDEFSNMYAMMGSGNNPNVNPVFEIYRAPPQDTLVKLKEGLIAKGLFGYRALTQAFYTADKNKSGTLDRSEFIWVMKEVGITLTKTEFDNIFRFFDKNCDDQISYSQFIQTIREPLNERRYSVVNAAFEKLDADQQGTVTVELIQNLFNLKAGEKYLSQKIDPQKEWWLAFDNINQDGQVSFNQFVEFYTDLSAEIQNCQEFVALVAESWNL